MKELPQGINYHNMLLRTLSYTSLEYSMWLRLGTQKKGTIIQKKHRYHPAKKLVDMTGEQKCITTVYKAFINAQNKQRIHLYLVRKRMI